MFFKIIGKIKDIEVIATNKSIHEIKRIQRAYGKGRWRKLKGNVKIELKDGFKCFAELHWYEAHGIGKREIKIKKYII